MYKEIDNYGLLRITQKGKEYIKKPVSFMIVDDVDFDDGDYEETSELGDASLSPELYAILKELRHDMAEKQDIPPYVIFQDISLEHMATMYPITLEELQNIPGVGAGKAKRFGEKFIKVIKKYCEENEIERPEDLRIRTVAKKSLAKVKIIQSIDNQRPLEEIAETLNMDFEDLLDELDAIVYSGTKINIDYYLREILDEDQIEDIYGYFLESDTDRISVAMNELGGEYQEDEVRLVRLKFMSEMAN